MLRGELFLHIQIYPLHLQDTDNLHISMSALVPLVMDRETH